MKTTGPGKHCVILIGQYNRLRAILPALRVKKDNIDYKWQDAVREGVEDFLKKHA